MATACVIGNFLEYFDFAIYGFFAVSIGTTFFPTNGTSVVLLQSLAVFGVAFLIRPLGGVVFGVIGDRIGRRASLSLSILVMGVATALIGLVPSYASIGFVAPVLLAFLRWTMVHHGLDRRPGGSLRFSYSIPHSKKRTNSVLGATEEPRGPQLVAASVPPCASRRREGCGNPPR